MTYERHDIVKVPFPFTDRQAGKTRIENLIDAGLPAPSIIRLKLFTLDNRLILAKLGQLASADQVVVEQHLKTLFCW